jgi:hypothetical protein
MRDLKPVAMESYKFQKARNAQFDPETSDPFTVGEFIAVRDEPKSWFYSAKVTTVRSTYLIVHYYRCKSVDLKKAKCYPFGH